MLNLFNHIKDSVKQKSEDGVQFVWDNAWRVRTIPYYLADNWQATVSATVAATTYAVSSASEEMDSFNVVANSLTYLASGYAAYSLYKNYQNKKAVEARINAMDIDEHPTIDTDFFDPSYNHVDVDPNAIAHRTRSSYR